MVSNNIFVIFPCFKNTVTITYHKKLADVSLNDNKHDLKVYMYCTLQVQYNFRLQL